MIVCLKRHPITHKPIKLIRCQYQENHSRFLEAEPGYQPAKYVYCHPQDLADPNRSPFILSLDNS